MDSQMKVLLADDHALFREGMRHVLSGLADGVEIVEASDCEQALEAADAHDDIALVLLDLNMPGRGGFAALETLSREHLALPIVVLSGSESRTDMQRALEAGAMGFIPKSSTAPVMLSALRLVLAGGVYVPPELVQSGAGEPAIPLTENKPALTPRQIDVLARVVEGKRNKVIGNELGLSEATVKAHVTAVFKALGVTNRIQAARAAERLRLKPTGGKTGHR
jgi:DNA-binding NarL/FixJ family response regulator